MDFHQSVCVAPVQRMQALDCLDFFQKLLYNNSNSQGLGIVYFYS